MSEIAKSIGIPIELWGDFDCLDIDYNEDTGSHDEMVYGYYFIVPEDAAPELLKAMEWDVGDSIAVDKWVIENEE